MAPGLPGSYATDTETETETEASTLPPAPDDLMSLKDMDMDQNHDDDDGVGGERPSVPQTPVASGSRRSSALGPPTGTADSLEESSSVTPSAPQTPRNPVFVSSLTPPTPADRDLAPGQAPERPPPRSKSPSLTFEPTETEKALPSQTGREIWIAGEEGGRPGVGRSGSDGRERDWKEEAKERIAKGEEVPELQWRTLEGLPKRRSHSKHSSAGSGIIGGAPPAPRDDAGGSSWTGAPPPPPLTSPTVHPVLVPSHPPELARLRQDSAEGSFTGVGSSAAYKLRSSLGSLPPGAAPASTPGPQHSSHLHRTTVMDDTPPSSRPPRPPGEDADGVMIAEDDIIGAIKVDRRAGKAAEYASTDPALLGRAVSRSADPVRRRPSAGGDFRTVRHGTQPGPGPLVSPPAAAAGSSGTPTRRSSSGALLNEAAAMTPPPAAHAAVDGGGTLRASRSADLMRNSLPPIASWSRYPSPVAVAAQAPSPYEVTTKDPMAGNHGPLPSPPTGRPPAPSARASGVNGVVSPLGGNALSNAAVLSGVGPSRAPLPPTPSAVPNGVDPSLPPNIGAEVCVECMMRDQDMADVDVTSPGVWARRSDLDFQEVLAHEDADDMAALRDLHRRGSVATSGQCSSVSGEERGAGTANTTAESGSPAARARASHHGRGTGGSRESMGQERVKGIVMGSMGGRRRKIGRGQALTQPALKLWTQMTPPASSHRWKTLQSYLQEQSHLLELEQRARAAQQNDHDRLEHSRRRSVDARSQLSLRTSQSDTSRVGITGAIASPALASGSDLSFLNSAPPPPTSGRGRSQRQSAVLPNGMVVETVDVARDEREARSRAKSRNRQSRVSMPSPASAKSASPAASLRSYSYGDQPWLADGGRSAGGSPVHSGGRAAALGAGRLGASSMSDLQQQGRATPRSVSPSRYSVNSRRSMFFDGGGGRGPFGFWGKGRRSASHSVFSFAPSGSMIDMHVGLSQDRHNGVYGMASGSGMMASLNDSVASFDDRGGIGSVPQPRPERRGSSISDRPASPTKSKKKKKGLKGLLNKLGIGSHRTSTVSAPGVDSSMRSSQVRDDDEEPLEPPPPLSILAREQNGRHSRNGSSNSLAQMMAPRPDPLRTSSAPVLDHRGADSALGSPASTYGPLTPTGTGGYGRNTSHDMLAEELADLPTSSRRVSPVDVYPRSSSPSDSRRWTAGGVPPGMDGMGSLRKERSLPRLPNLSTVGKHYGRQPNGDYVDSPTGGYEGMVDDAGYVRKSMTSGRAPWNMGTLRSTSAPGPAGDDEGMVGFDDDNRRESRRGTSFDQRSVASRSGKSRSRVLSAVFPAKLRGGTSSVTSSPRVSAAYGFPRNDPTASGNVGVAGNDLAEELSLPSPPPPHHPSYRDHVPTEKTRHAVHRAPDFVALRYAVPAGR